MNFGCVLLCLLVPLLFLLLRDEWTFTFKLFEVEGSFKILQISDTHLGVALPRSGEWVALLGGIPLSWCTASAEEKPDLIFSGDNVVGTETSKAFGPARPLAGGPLSDKRQSR